MFRRFLALPVVALAVAVMPAWGQTPVQRGTSAAAMTQLGPNQYLAKKDIIGMGAYDPNNQHVGEVEDLVVERNGQISAAIIARGGVLGVGEKHVVVPLSQIAVDDAAKRVHINFTSEQLAQAPRFDYGHSGGAVRSGSSTAPAR